MLPEYMLVGKHHCFGLAYILVLLGAFAWLGLAAFQENIITRIFGMYSNMIYWAIGISALVLTAKKLRLVRS